MENSRFWLFLGLGVTAMLSLKYVASPDAGGDSLNRFKLSALHFGVDADDGAVDARRLHAHGGTQMTPHLRPSLAGLATSMRKTTSTTIGTAPALTKKVEPKKGEKKKDDTKKTKKKKEDVNAGQFQIPAQEQAAQPSATPATFNAAASPYAAPANQNVAYTASAASAATNPKNMSLHDWEDLLIASPSYAETAKFIQAYQAKSVTADIFYAIVTEMLASKTAALNQYGVLCLQMTPSVMSLTKLVEITNTDATITSSVTKAESAYIAISYLPVLETSLSTLTSASDLTTVLGLMTQSVTKNLVPATATNSGATIQGGITATTKTAYSALATDLIKLQAKATDATISEAMSKVLSTLAGFGITGTSATTATVAEASRE